MLQRLGFPDVGTHRRFVSALAIDAVGSGIWMPLSMLYFLHHDLSLVQLGAGDDDRQPRSRSRWCRCSARSSTGSAPRACCRPATPLPALGFAALPVRPLAGRGDRCWSCVAAIGPDRLLGRPRPDGHRDHASRGSARCGSASSARCATPGSPSGGAVSAARHSRSAPGRLPAVVVAQRRVVRAGVRAAARRARRRAAGSGARSPERLVGHGARVTGPLPAAVAAPSYATRPR